jgi:glutathione peroxidase
MKTWIAILIFLSGVATYVIIVNKNSKEMTIRQKMLKAFYPAIMWMSKKGATTVSNEKNVQPNVDFYSLKIMLNNDSIFDMNIAKGKKILIVNTASDCGFTAQYEALETLSKERKDSLIVIGFPANDFSQQEKSSDEKIASFCKLNYGVTFPIAKKGVVIKNSNQQEVYKWLSDKSLNGWNDKAPTWNFCKYIIDEKGVLTHFFNSSVNPLGEELRRGL